MGTIQLFHGDGTATSRKLLQDAINLEKGVGNDIRIIEGDKLAPRDLESVLGTSNLFGNETLVIEGLMGRLRSKDKDACIELLSKYSGSKNLLLWDKKALTKIATSKLGKNVKSTESKAPTALFNFMESIYPGNAEQALSLLHEVVAGTEDIIAFTMLARQISYLIMIKSGTNPKFSPWQMGKLRAQASKWDGKQLEIFLADLLKIDFAIKTGATKLSYTDHLDLLLTTLLR
jgi:DNA polymerase III delta subunit